MITIAIIGFATAILSVIYAYLIDLIDRDIYILHSLLYLV